MKKPFSHSGHAVLGLAEGALVSIMPLPINFGFILLFLILWPISLVRSVTPVERMGHLIKIGVGVMTVVVAILLPVKHLDGRVGPMDYEPMSLYELSRHLYEDWRIPTMIYDSGATNTFLTFRIDKRVSRRFVLDKLAKDTDRELRIRRCGTGATFLFGAHPSFTTLRPREAQSGHPD